MTPITIFSFGYWGWGSTTQQLVESIDAVEKSRGYLAPLFVDIRLSRNVRAAGFDGNDFEKVVGPSRYRWMDSLGNLGIRDGGGMRIKDPAAAGTLLDFAIDASKSGQRIIFYCACARPCDCHRSVVARLVSEASTNRGQVVEIVEWPGGEPQVESFEITLSRKTFDKVRTGAATIPLATPCNLAVMAAVPWYSLVLVRPEDEDWIPTWRLVTGPARYKKGAWCLPVFGVLDDLSSEAARAEVLRAREADGYQPMRSHVG